MLDSDLARLYRCTNGTKDLNKAVKRNPERFPKEFMFQLTKEEYMQLLRFQIGTANNGGSEILRFQTETAKYKTFSITRVGDDGVRELLISKLVKLTE